MLTVVARLLKSSIPWQSDIYNQSGQIIHSLLKFEPLFLS